MERGPDFFVLTLVVKASTVGIDYARSVVSYEEQYMPVLQEVQDLKEGRDCLVLSLDDSRQLLFLDVFQN